MKKEFSGGGSDRPKRKWHDSYVCFGQLHEHVKVVVSNWHDSYVCFGQLHEHMNVVVSSK